MDWFDSSGLRSRNSKKHGFQMRSMHQVGFCGLNDWISSSVILEEGWFKTFISLAR